MNKFLLSLCLIASIFVMMSCSEDERTKSTLPKYADVKFTVNGQVVGNNSVPVGKKVVVTLVTEKKAANVYRYDYTWSCSGVTEMSPTTASNNSSDATNSFVAQTPGFYTLTIDVKCYNGADGDVANKYDVKISDGEIIYLPGVLYGNVSVTKFFTVK